jgi:hypothetical protein
VTQVAESLRADLANARMCEWAGDPPVQRGRAGIAFGCLIRQTPPSQCPGLGSSSVGKNSGTVRHGTARHSPHPLRPPRVGGHPMGHGPIRISGLSREAGILCKSIARAPGAWQCASADMGMTFFPSASRGAMLVPQNSGTLLAKSLGPSRADGRTPKRGGRCPNPTLVEACAKGGTWLRPHVTCAGVPGTGAAGAGRAPARGRRLGRAGTRAAVLDSPARPCSPRLSGRFSGKQPPQGGDTRNPFQAETSLTLSLGARIPSKTFRKGSRN